MMACFATVTVETKMGRQIGPYPEESDGGQALFNARCTVRTIIGMMAVALVGCSTSDAQQAAPVPQEKSAPVAGPAPASNGLSDLDAMTFGCVKAGLNVAAAEAAKVPSQGTYQFSYFKIINDSHHSSYEIHFKSNYQGEADLKYCVAVYCQQGWDPKTTKISVRLMSNERQEMGAAAHETVCGQTQAPTKRRLRR
jgi:hypothetical protein